MKRMEMNGERGINVNSTKWIRSDCCSIGVTEEGGINGFIAKEWMVDLVGETHLRGCMMVGEVSVRTYVGDGGMSVTEYSKLLEQKGTGRQCILTDRYYSTRTGIRWEIEIEGKGSPWSTAIETVLEYPQARNAGFWTAWADPDSNKLTDMGGIEQEQIANATVAAEMNSGGFEWTDPLVARPFENRRFWYGAPYYDNDNPRILYCPFLTDIICIPMATVLEEEHDQGMSILLSPEDSILDLTLQTTEKGELIFSRWFHRISEKNVLSFSLDLIVHEADWRGGLRGLVERYPSYLYPTNPAAREIAGTGAYSVHDVDFNVDKLKKMSFRVNWKASFDFPYMGMFLPPVGEHEQWERFGGGITSIAHMRDYSAEMSQMGFHVLSYFNVTEFGTGIRFPAPNDVAMDLEEDDLWRDCHAFLYGRLKDAILHVPRNAEPIQQLYGRIEPGQPYWTWEGAIAMDPGEASYQEFLLDQAERHMELLPDASGICIDRMDWLRVYNDRRDDGISWFDDGPARSLLVSWRELMERLSAVVHENGKVIYCNNHIKRLDLLRHIDGLFDEFTYAGAPMNTSALLGLFKPVLGWVGTEKHLLPDPDAFFHKFMYMGIFPMAPFPGNDHSLGPSEWVDHYYLDYGPLLSALVGKQWVLEPHAIEVDQPSAKANIFQVPDGYVMPVVFGGTDDFVTITINVPDLPKEVACEYIHPGQETWSPLAGVERRDNVMQINVPLSRGCAMVRLYS